MALTIHCECGWPPYYTEEKYAGYKIKCKNPKCGRIITIQVNQAVIPSKKVVGADDSHKSANGFQVDVNQQRRIFTRSFLLALGVGVALILGITSLIVALAGRGAVKEIAVKEASSSSIPNTSLPQQNLTAPNTKSQPALNVELKGTPQPYKSSATESKTPAVDFSHVQQASSEAGSSSGTLRTPSFTFLSEPTRDPILNPTPILKRPPVSLPTGTNIEPARGPKGLGTLKVNNGTSLDGAVKLINTSAGSRVCRYVYVRANSELLIKGVGPGAYILQFGLGEDWDENTHSFLRNKSYSQFDDRLEFSEIRDEGGINFSTFEVTLQPVLDGNALTTAISEKEFQTN
jgi:hypothetical protein